MRATIDIDHKNELEDTLNRIRAIGVEFEVEQSTGGNYHVILKNLDMTFAESVFLRRYLHDDVKRNGLDFSFMLDPRKPKQVLFNRKTKNGEVLMSRKVELNV
jgi:hypothetical protein